MQPDDNGIVVVDFFLLSMFRAWLEQYCQVHQLMQHADGFAADG